VLVLPLLPFRCRFGTLKLTIGAGHRAQLLYTDNFLNKPASVGNTQAFVYTAADPTGMRAGKQYDYWTGNLLKSFQLRPNSSTEEQLVTTSYDFADRPLQTTPPTGAWVKTFYWDNLLYVTTLQKTDTVSGTAQVGFSFVRSDGAGRTLGKGSDHPSATAGKYSGQKFVYNYKGEQSDQSNVTAMNALWTPIDEDAGAGWLFVNYQYDAQGRVKQLTHPDATFYQADYLGCGCAGATITTTDERGCKVQTVSDFLGRLTTAKELYLDTLGTLVTFNTANYTYDVLGRLTQIDVKQGNNGTQTQTRTFSYDHYGRLASETTPEAGTMSYSYNANDQMASKTDARGKITRYAYNTRSLVTNVSYNDSTPGASYGYDEFGARTAMTDGEGTMSYIFDAHRRLQSETRTFTGLTGKFYKLSYAYNEAGQLKQVNYNASTSQSAVTPPPPQQQIAAAPAAANGAMQSSSWTKDLGFHFWPSKAQPFRSLLQYSASPVTVTSAASKAFTAKTTPKQTPGRTISGYTRRSAALGNTPLPWTLITATRIQGSSGPESVDVYSDANGFYSIPDLPEDPFTEYRVIASLSLWTFAPSAADLALYDDRTQDFIGTPTSPTVTISGTLTNSNNGQPISGVTMTLSGGMNQTTTTNGQGQYSFTVNAAYNYTVTPTASGWTFSPTQRSYTDVLTSQTGNFTGTQTGAPPPPPSGSGPQTFSYNVNYAQPGQAGTK
jgi:YD repeat-containing protein